MGFTDVLTWAIENAALGLGFLLVLVIICFIGFVIVRGMAKLITGN